MLPLTFAVLAILTGALDPSAPAMASPLPKDTQELSSSVPARLSSSTLFTFATGWSTSSNHLNAALYWLAIAGYEFFILLFTLLRPRWLTTIIAIDSAASAPLGQPLSSACRSLQSRTAHHRLHRPQSHQRPRSVGIRRTADSSGFDLTIYSHPSWTHFLRHRRQASHYYSGQCDAARASATLQPDGKHVLMSCPAAPDQQPDAARNLVVKLY